MGLFMSSMFFVATGIVIGYHIADHKNTQSPFTSLGKSIDKAIDSEPAKERKPYDFILEPFVAMYLAWVGPK